MSGQRYDIELEIANDDLVELSVSDETSVDIGLEEQYVERHYSTPPPATTTTIGGIIVGENLKITEEGILSVDTADAVESDNTKPITSAAVFTEVGNINILLSTI